MAESSWPDPAAGRVVDDSQFEKLGYALGAAGGVVGDFTSPQLVYGDSSGMTVKVGASRYALVAGHMWYSGPTIFTKAIGSNSSGSTRTDLVVLRLSRTTWAVTVVVIAGTPGSGAPAPVQNLGTTGSFDIPLATVTVASGASSISAANVAYVAPHLTVDDGGIRVQNFAALTYVPLPYPGQIVKTSTGDTYRYASGTWYFQGGNRTSFTPTMAASSGGLVMGTAAVRTGWYTRLPGNIVVYHFFVRFGTSGASAGTGTYSWTLPITAADAASGAVPAYGSGQVWDQSSTTTATTLLLIPASDLGTVQMISGANAVTHNSPFTWGHQDYFAGTITYPV